MKQEKEGKQEKQVAVNVSPYAEQDKKLFQEFMYFIQANGFVPRAQLIKEFGDKNTTKCLAVLHKTWRVLVESREPYDGQDMLGLKIAERRFSKAEVNRMPYELSFLPEMIKQTKSSYGEYKELAIRCRWTAPILGSLPRLSDEKIPETLMAFERTPLGDVLIQRHGIRAMFARGLKLCNYSSYAVEHFGFESIVLHHVKVKNNHIRGQQNERGDAVGTIRSECIDAGVEFVLRILFPATFMSPNDVVRIVRTAGRMVGLSPGRSAGYGDFEIVKIETDAP